MFVSQHGARVMRLTFVALVIALIAIPFAGTVRAADTVTLTYGWWSNGPSADAAHCAWLDSFEKANPTIKIQSEILPWDAYKVFRDLGWINTFLPILVPKLFGSAFDIFLFRQFFLGLPREIDEAARLDGCNAWRIYRHRRLEVSAQG